MEPVIPGLSYIFSSLLSDTGYVLIFYHSLAVSNITILQRRVERDGTKFFHKDLHSRRIIRSSDVTVFLVYSSGMKKREYNLF